MKWQKVNLQCVRIEHNGMWAVIHSCAKRRHEAFYGFGDAPTAIGEDAFDSDRFERKVDAVEWCMRKLNLNLEV